jgi:dTDP-4-dehydrorhamnose reductase
MHVDDTANTLIDLADNGFEGIYNVCGSEPISRYDLSLLLAKMIKKVSIDVEVDLSACKLAEIPFVEKRPLNTSLSNGKIADLLGVKLRSLQELCLEVAEQHFAQNELI